MVRLYQTIRKDGKIFTRGYIQYAKRKREFQMEETTIDRTFEKLRILRDNIDAIHPRKQDLA